MHTPVLQQNFWLSFKAVFVRDVERGFSHNVRGCAGFPWPSWGPFCVTLTCSGRGHLGCRILLLVTKWWDIRSGANCSVKPEAGFFPVEMSGTSPFYLGCLLLWGKDCALQPGLDVHFPEPGTERSQGTASAWIWFIRVGGGSQHPWSSRTWEDCRGHR